MEAYVQLIRFADGDGRNPVTIDLAMEDQPRIRIATWDQPPLRLTIQQARVLTHALQRLLDGR